MMTHYKITIYKGNKNNINFFHIDPNIKAKITRKKLFVITSKYTNTKLNNL